MRSILRYILTISIFIAVLHDASATHNRAGEITYTQIDELTIRVKVTTYTKGSNSSVDRDSLELIWGDGTADFIYRTNGNGQLLGNDVKVNTYEAEHTYPGRATYTLAFQDPNRVSNILNVNSPNSVEVPFFLSTSFTFLNNQFQGFNSSAVLLQAPIDFACVGKRFVHNPNAFDPDGDSLAYELIVPFQTEGVPVPDYFYPDQIAPGINNNLTLDEVTGNLVWDAPQIAGEYNVAFRINEYREGFLINSIIRDMQILVAVCDNDPPVIDVIEEICVIAGTQLNIPLEIIDPNQNDLVALSATGGIFTLPSNPAILSPFDQYLNLPYNASLVWQTTCNDIRKEPYQVVFRAVDNGLMNGSGLADLKTLRIKVVGPSPEIVSTETEGQSIRVNWALPYACEVTNDEYFQGFSVWRKIRSNQFELDTCDPGLDGKEYVKIEFLTKNNTGAVYTYLDTDVERGQTYCYRILAEFAQLSVAGNPFNRVESLPSNEVCQVLARDIPLLTEVSVIDTDNANGTISVQWVKPIPEELDTMANPGPYTYELIRSDDLNQTYTPVAGATFTKLSFNEDIDTFFLDTGLNTAANRYYYQVAFYTNGNTDTPYGYSSEASSVYLNSSSADQKIELSWDHETPWENYLFKIYRRSLTSGLFEFLDDSEASSYTDQNLINEQEYCYRIESIGSYGFDNITDPIINYSQEVCLEPIDNQAPCAVLLEVNSVCENEDIQNLEPEDLINELVWPNPNLICEETDDVVSYNVYYSQLIGEAFELIITIEGAENNRYEHMPENGILGCYQVTSVDEKGNESLVSNTVCVDNCPLYELPNTFTPNNDGSNDIFIPTINKFIDEVDFKVFNRWGNLVFETSEPNLNWTGLTSNNKELSEGTYYYVCTVYEQRVEGILQRRELLRGNILLIR